MPATSQPVKFSPEQQSELVRLKAYFPFRIVWGAINPQDLSFQCAASHTMHKPKALARKGWHVEIVS